MLREIIRGELAKIINDDLEIKISEPERSENGDYSTNVAFLLAKKEGRKLQEVAKELALRLSSGQFAERVAAKNGFVNIFLKDEVLLKALGEKEKFPKKKEKINVEFVSANPTGPLTMANGRGGFYGDVLSNVLKKTGYDVTREYYINDAGNQIKLLGESIQAAEGKIPEKEEYYKGEYIKKLKGKSAAKAASILLKEIKNSLKKAGIKFDVWFSEEKNLRKTGELKKVLELLNKEGVIKEGAGALWLDDNVLVKSNQEFTYFLSDLAYHYDKFIKRKFDLVINIWGADHHGYVARMQKGAEALSVNPARLKIIIMQLVRLISQGKEVKMSKRAGEFITLDDLLKEVGLDAARWFFLERSPDTHMDFDLDLAKERSKKNPVYYVQYAHARACSILRKGKAGKKPNLQLLIQPEEFTLIKKILQLSEIIEDITGDFQVHRLTRYVYELAQAFTNFYEKQHVIDKENKELTQARLALVSATQKTIKNGLNLLGISAPEKM